MRAISIAASGEVELVEAPEPTIGDDEVLIRVDLVGICATDVHILHGTFPTARYPVRPGHEATGIVEQAGAAVAGLAVGDRVVIDPGVPCRRCRACRIGRLNLCENRRAFGIDLPGAAATFIAVPAVNCFRVDPEVPASSAVLAEPLACVVHALDLVPSPAGQDVLVYGAGTIGLLAVVVARSLGAATVTVVDRATERLGLAARLGAVRTESALDSGAGAAWELVIDATGAPPAIADGLTRVASGGAFLQIGVASAGARVEIAPYDVFARELQIQGSMTTRYSFPRAIRLLEAGIVDGSLFTSPPFGAEDYAEAIAGAGSGTVPKVVIAP